MAKFDPRTLYDIVPDQIVIEDFHKYAEEFVAREILPHVPDAWVDPDYTDEHDGKPGRVGYEINFNRYFYTYEPPRPLDEIGADIQAAQARIAGLMEEIVA